MKRSVDGEMIKGHTDMLILALLNSGSSMHGYRIRQELIDGSQQAFGPSLGRIYPLLVQMEKKSWVKSRQETVCESRVRNTYSITAKGRAELQVRIKKWDLFAAGINRILKPCN